MTLTYAISLTVIALLSGVVHLVLDKVIEHQSQTGTIVNISGQQRMLSQRASLFTIEYIISGSMRSHKIATDSIEQMRMNQLLLVGSEKELKKPDWRAPMSPELNTLYSAAPFYVTKNLNMFTKSIENALSRDPIKQSLTIDIDRLDFVVLSRTILIDGLHAVVNQYEKEALIKIDDLRSAQKVVFWIILLTIFIEALFIFRPMVAKISQYANRLEHEAKYDALTGILNRGGFNLLADNAIASATRNKVTLSVIMCDIDFFKRVNDTYGHVVGDKVIKSVANELDQCIRKSDILARYGGEEYIILLPQTKVTDAHLLASKLCQRISELVLEIDDKKFSVTMSFGVADLINYDMEIGHVITRADSALYLSKQQGRNMVTAC
jgi:diguanylate cyclase (GGDEF)-like protein